LGRGCTFAHGEKELVAWNDHLEKMELKKKKKTEEESNKKEDDHSAVKSKVNVSLIKEEIPAPTYKVWCFKFITVQNELNPIYITLLSVFILCGLVALLPSQGSLVTIKFFVFNKGRK